MKFFPAAALALLTATAADASTGELGHPWRWGGWMMNGFPGGIVMMAIFLIAIATVAFLILRKQQDTQHYGFPREETPLDILKRRYASGEIDRDQYEQMRKDI